MSMRFCRYGLLVLALSLLWQGTSWAQEKAAENPKTEEKPAAAAAPAAELPAYYTGADAKKWPDPIGANAGYWTTPSASPGDDDPAKLTNAGLYDRIVHNLYSINMVWTMLAGFLVMFMQAGFAMVEGGLCRAKNASHTFAMNMMVYPLGCMAFWVYGFAIGWGNWFNGPVPPGWYASLGPGVSVLNEGIGIGGEPNLPTYGLLGTKGFCLHGVDDVSVMALFFFMMVFMDTTATIPTGAMAERWAWKSFVIYGLWVALPYCIYANWVWGGGWLAQAGKNWGLGHGAVDFAGSGVVHAMGGVIALGRRHLHRPPYRQVSERKASGDSRSRYSGRHHRYLYPVLRVVRLQSGFDAGRHRSAHQRSRGEHDAGGRGRVLVVDVLHDDSRHEARPLDDVQRHAGRFGGHHGSLCLRR